MTGRGSTTTWFVLPRCLPCGSTCWLVGYLTCAALYHTRGSTAFGSHTTYLLPPPFFARLCAFLPPHFSWFVYYLPLRFALRFTTTTPPVPVPPCVCGLTFAVPFFALSPLCGFFTTTTTAAPRTLRIRLSATTGSFTPPYRHHRHRSVLLLVLIPVPVLRITFFTCYCGSFFIFARAFIWDIIFIATYWLYLPAPRAARTVHDRATAATAPLLYHVHAWLARFLRVRVRSLLPARHAIHGAHARCRRRRWFFCRARHAAAAYVLRARHAPPLRAARTAPFARARSRGAPCRAGIHGSVPAASPYRRTARTARRTCAPHAHAAARWRARRAARFRARALRLPLPRFCCALPAAHACARTPARGSFSRAFFTGLLYSGWFFCLLLYTCLRLLPLLVAPAALRLCYRLNAALPAFAFRCLVPRRAAARGTHTLVLRAAACNACRAFVPCLRFTTYHYCTVCFATAVRSPPRRRRFRCVCV